MKNLRIALIVILIVVGAAILIKIIGSFRKEPPIGSDDVSVRLVDVRTANPQMHYAKINLLGKVEAKNKVEIYAEVTGVLQSPNFEEGRSFKKGEVLVDINSDEYAQNLKSQKGKLITEVAQVLGDVKVDFPEEATKWETFLSKINIEEKLPKLPEIESEQLKKFISGRGLITSYYNVVASEERLLKYMIIAPYDGSLVMTAVKNGTLVRSGQKLGEYIATSNYEFVSEVSVSDLDFLKIGTSIELKNETGSQVFSGRIVRINNQVDPATQRVKIYVSVSGNNLKDGMYLSGVTSGIELPATIPVERQQLIGNQLYVVQDSSIVKREVTILFQDDVFAYVQGLEKGDQVLVSNLKGLYQGMKVSVKK
jgi:multidrug efflux pump subunit AcrA (membrane-fusion protein)